MIKSRVPDLVSQMELITAFTSEYMQESSDGCLMSQTYMQFLGTLTYLIEMDYGLHIKGLDKTKRSSNFVINEKASFKGKRIPKEASGFDSSVENSFDNKGHNLLDII